MRRLSFLAALSFAAILVLAGGEAFVPTRFAMGAPGTSSASPDPWPKSALITPETLRKELGSKNKPKVVCVGFPILYQGAHIPGALIEGPASEATGLANLKQWAHRIPKASSLVIYCGCCPFRACPNIRPAYEALRAAGLTRIQVLYLPNDFRTSWINKGDPNTAKR